MINVKAVDRFYKTLILFTSKFIASPTKITS